MLTLEKEFRKAAGKAEGSVVVDISYDIIRHVSMQLYTNPRKAIEELICHGYDAGAAGELDGDDLKDYLRPLRRLAKSAIP